MIKMEGNTFFHNQDVISSFTCKCEKCGSEKVSLVNGIAMGSEWTGQYGSIDLVCGECGNSEEVYS